MIDHEAVRQTMRKRLLTVQGVTKTNCQWENRKFVPPATGLWLRETLIPISETRVGNQVVSFYGYFQYDLFAKEGTGTEEIGKLSRLIGVVFKAGQSLVDEVTVIIERAPEIRTPPRAGPYYARSVLVYVRVHEITEVSP